MSLAISFFSSLFLALSLILGFVGATKPAWIFVGVTCLVQIAYMLYKIHPIILKQMALEKMKESKEMPG